MKLMSRNRRVAVAGIAAAALAVGAATVAAGPAHSARGSCVSAKAPKLSRGSLFGRATHACGGRGKMYVFLQARYGNGAHVYTLASGSTTGTLLMTAARKCPISGTWHAWTFATRGFKTNTSRVVSYSCRS